MYSPMSAKSTISLTFSCISSSEKPRMEPFKKMFS